MKNIIFKIIIILQLTTFLATAFAFSGESTSTLAPQLRTTRDNFKGPYLIASICRLMEREPRKDQPRPPLAELRVKDLTKRIDAVHEQYPDVRMQEKVGTFGYGPVEAKYEEVIVEIPKEGVAIRYFNPKISNSVTPFSDVGYVKTRIINENLHRQIIFRTIAPQASPHQYKFLKDPSFRNDIMKSMTAMVLWAKKKNIKTVFANGVSASPAALFFKLCWERFYPGEEAPAVFELPSAGRVGEYGVVSRYKEDEVLSQIQATPNLQAVLSKPILVLDEIVSDGYTVAKTRDIFKERFGALDVYAAGMLLYDKEPDSDMMQYPKALVDWYPDAMSLRVYHSSSNWHRVRTWIRGESPTFFDEVYTQYKRTPEQEKIIFNEFLPEDLAALASEAYETSDIGQLVRSIKDFLPKNRDFMSGLKKEGRDILLRIPVEVVKGIGTEHVRGFLGALRLFPNIHVELYSSSGLGEVSDKDYEDAGLVKRALPKDFKPTRENTVTLIPAKRDEHLDQTDVVSRIGGVKLRPTDTILSPVGKENDPSGLIRSIIIGFKIMSVAQQVKEKGIDSRFKDKVFLEILEQIKDACGFRKNEYGFDEAFNNLTVDDIIALANGQTNALISALNKLIRILPITPINVKELEDMHESARQLMLSA